MRDFTPEEMANLARYEEHLAKAYYSNFMRYPGRNATQEIAAIYREAMGSPLNVDPICSACVLNLLRRVGELYFAQKNKPIKQTRRQPRKTKV